MAAKSLRDLMREKNVSKEDLTPEQRKQFDKLKNDVSQYQDVSQMVNDLQKLSKGINGRDVNAFMNQLKPMLNQDQQNRLSSILNSLGISR